jgi:hypothetical protein
MKMYLRYLSVNVKIDRSAYVFMFNSFVFVLK